MISILKYEILKPYKVVVFDLDNTLYDENEYLFAAYADIGYYVGKRTGKKASVYEDYLVQTFQEEGRCDLLNKFISYFSLKEIVTKDNLLYLLRNCNKTLNVYENQKELLCKLLQAKHIIYILTNGNVLQQKNKINHLDIPDILTKIKLIYANEFIPKPSPYCLNKIIENERVTTRDIVFVGDSKIDKEAAAAAEIDFINVYDYRI